MEIRAARYFDGFQQKSQKEQLEFVHDSRKQIEELIGEVKSILSEQGGTIPNEIKTIILTRIQELSSDELFSRLNGLKRLLGSSVLLNANNKSVSEFVERSKDCITEYVEQLSKVEVTQYAFTTAQYEEWITKLEENMPSPSIMKAAYEMATYKPFPAYEKLLVSCINKIAKNEKKGFFAEDFSFREEEILDVRKWFTRVRQSKNAAIWLLTYEMLLSFVKDVHDKRVELAKSEYASRR